MPELSSAPTTELARAGAAAAAMAAGLKARDWPGAVDRVATAATDALERASELGISATELVVDVQGREQEITADLPAATQFLSPRLFLNTGATAAAVAYDCAGVYLETDF